MIYYTVYFESKGARFIQGARLNWDFRVYFSDLLSIDTPYMEFSFTQIAGWADMLGSDTRRLVMLNTQ